MRILKAIPLLVLFALVFGISLIGFVPTVNAQDTPPDTTRNQDEDDADESPAKQKELARKAKISKKEAKRIALERVPGEIIEVEIEMENGRLQWAIDIRGTDGKLYDVEIDANTGAVLQAIEEDDEDGEEDEDPDGTMSKVFKKTAKGVRSTAGKFIRLVRWD